MSQENNIEKLKRFDLQKTKILKYILFKKRTEQEVRQKFCREIEPNQLEKLIEELKENNYINDEQYIKKSIDEIILLKVLSRKEIIYKLQRKGISNENIEKYFEMNSEELEEYEKRSAKKIISKKQPYMEEEELRKYLFKKGYEEHIIKQAIQDEYF